MLNLRPEFDWVQKYWIWHRALWRSRPFSLSFTQPPPPCSRFVCIAFSRQTHTAEHICMIDVCFDCITERDQPNMCYQNQLNDPYQKLVCHRLFCRTVYYVMAPISRTNFHYGKQRTLSLFNFMHILHALQQQTEKKRHFSFEHFKGNRETHFFSQFPTECIKHSLNSHEKKMKENKKKKA